ncbi:MAG: hypothetical protein Q3971_03870 [Moraxella sp.]|nr:hypothetical protein [Moraxella sp.]
MGFIIADNITLHHDPCPISPTAIQRTSEHIGFGEIIPITMNDNSENVLIFDGESGVLIFRRSAL